MCVQLNLRTQKPRIQKTKCVCACVNNLHVSGPAQFKPVLFKGQPQSGRIHTTSKLIDLWVFFVYRYLYSFIFKAPLFLLKKKKLEQVLKGNKTISNAMRSKDIVAVSTAIDSKAEAHQVKVQDGPRTSYDKNYGSVQKKWTGQEAT